MVEKMKRQFILVDYELELLKKMQSLKQGSKIIKEYTKEFQKNLIRTGHLEITKENVTRYINRLRSSIQEETAVVRVVTMEYAYQITLKIEKRMNNRFENKQNGKDRSYIQQKEDEQ